MPIIRRLAGAMLLAHALLAPVACTKQSAPSQTAGAGLPKLDVETYRLANGLSVVLHVDEKLPAVNVNLWYHVGSKDEKPGRTGLAHLFEHMMFQGSKNVKGEYLTLVEQAGANLRAGGVNGTTDNDRTNFFETVPTSSLEYALWLEADRMGFLLDTLDQKSLDNQRSVVQNEKRQGDNKPYAEQRYIIAEQMYPAGHPYAHSVIGSMEDLAAASLADVQAFFKKYYAPNNASLVLSGNFDKTQAKELVAKYFGPITPGEPITRLKAQVPTLGADKIVVHEEKTQQSKLTLVWHAPEYFHKDEPALDLLGRILGDGKNARLQRRLVREEKLATQVAAYHAGGEIAGLFYIEALLTPEASLDKARQIVLEELQRLAETGPTDTELKQRQALVEYEFVSELERIGGFGGKADRLNRYMTYLGRPDMFQQDYDRYQKITRQDVMQAAKAWLSDAHHLEVRFTPSKAGKPDRPEFDRAQAPSLAGTVPFAPPTVETKTLANGLDVYVVSRPGLPKVETALIVKRGDVGETDATAGKSYLTAVTVTEGTKTRTAEALQTELDGLGAELGAEGSKFGAAVSLAVLKRNLKPALGVLADVAQNPVFPDKEIDLAKSIRLQQIEQESNNPAVLAAELFPRILMAGGHPGGVPDRGTAASIKALTRDDLVKTHQAYWVPNNAALLVTGDVTLAEVEALATEAFGGWKRGDVADVTMPVAGAPVKPYVFLVDAPGAPQSQIRIGSVAPARPDNAYVGLQIANGILGGTFSSRLNLNLREDKGYAYGAYSGLTQNRWMGYWTAQAGVQTPSTVASLVEFKKEIEGLATGQRAVTEEELGGLKKNLSRSYMQNFETLGQVVRQVAPLISSGVPLNFLGDYVPLLLQQTPESVVATAKQYLDFNRTIILIVGDLSIIEGPVVTLGLGDVLVLSKDGKLLRKGGEQAQAAASAGQPSAAPAQPENAPAATAPNAESASVPVAIPPGGDGTTPPPATVVPVPEGGQTQPVSAPVEQHGP